MLLAIRLTSTEVPWSQEVLAAFLTPSFLAVRGSTQEKEHGVDGRSGPRVQVGLPHLATFSPSDLSVSVITLSCAVRYSHTGKDNVLKHDLPFLVSEGLGNLESKAHAHSVRKRSRHLR